MIPKTFPEKKIYFMPEKKLYRIFSMHIFFFLGTLLVFLRIFVGFYFGIGINASEFRLASNIILMFGLVCVFNVTNNAQL